jgi:hypothetical protein
MQLEEEGHALRVAPEALAGGPSDVGRVHRGIEAPDAP